MSSKKVVLITGCSSGFGMLIASLLSASCHVVATMRNLDKKEALLEAVNKQGGQVDVLPLDVTHPETIGPVVSFIQEQYGRLDVLINNAGMALGGFFEDLSDLEIRDQMEANFFGVQHVTRAVLPMMRAQKSGRIIMMSSIAGLTGTPCLSAYNASKWALEGFSESLYFELQPFGIDVVLVEPGVFKTGILQENLKLARLAMDSLSPYFELTQKIKTRVEGMIDKRAKDPVVVARLVAQLVDGSSVRFRYVVGKDARIRLFLKRVLPFSWYAWVLQRVFR